MDVNLELEGLIKHKKYGDLGQYMGLIPDGRLVEAGFNEVLINVFDGMNHTVDAGELVMFVGVANFDGGFIPVIMHDMKLCGFAKTASLESAYTYFNWLFVGEEIDEKN